MNEQVNYAKIQRIQDDLEALTIGQFGTGFVTDAMLYESGIKGTVANHTSQLADIVTLVPNGIDDTSNIQAILDAGKIPKLRPETYIISSVTLNDNAKILSSGYKTVLKQKSGVSAGTRILVVQGSNIVVDEMSYEGNIATDSGEQNHAVFIKNVSATIKNVSIKGINAKNIRGDGLYIGGATNYNPININIGNITVDNCYRNGVSITGGQNLNLGDIYTSNCGMMGVDLESDNQGGAIKNVKIGNIITSNLGVIAQGSTYPDVQNVQIGFVECRASRMTSTPDYPVTTSDSNGVIFRNAKNIKIKGLDIDGFNSFAIKIQKETGDRFSQNVEIGSLIVANCSLTDTTYNAYISLGVVNLKINNLVSTTQTGKTLFLGTSITGDEQNVIIENGTHNGGRFAYYCGLYAKNLNITTDTTAISYIKTLSKIDNCKINATTIIGYSGNVIFEGCNLTYSSAKESGTANIYRNNIINTVFTA